MCSICSGGFLFGYDIGVISSLLVLQDFVLRFGGAETSPGVYVLPDRTKSLITALLSAGTFFGSLAQAPISDWLGRKKAMMLWSLVFTIGAVIQTATIDAVAQLIVGRFIAGLAVSLDWGGRVVDPHRLMLTSLPYLLALIGRCPQWSLPSLPR